MAVILLSYFSTMVTVLAVLMVLLNGVLGASTFHPARAQTHLRVAYTQTIAPGSDAAAAPKAQQVAQISPVTHQASANSNSASGRERRPAIQQRATQQAFEQRTKPVRVARDERRKERIAVRRQEQEYATAMSYAPESREQLAAARIFGTVGSRGF
jgi:hypothetical protein